MMFQTDLPVSRDKKVIHCALAELVELLSKLKIMMVRFVISSISESILCDDSEL